MKKFREVELPKSIEFDQRYMINQSDQMLHNFIRMSTKTNKLPDYGKLKKYRRIRAVYLLRIQGYTIKNIASSLHCSQSTIKRDIDKIQKNSELLLIEFDKYRKSLSN